MTGASNCPSTLEDFFAWAQGAFNFALSPAKGPDEAWSRLLELLVSITQKSLSGRLAHVRVDLAETSETWDVFQDGRVPIEGLFATIDGTSPWQDGDPAPTVALRGTIRAPGDHELPVSIALNPPRQLTIDASALRFQDFCDFVGNLAGLPAGSVSSTLPCTLTPFTPRPLPAIEPDPTVSVMFGDLPRITACFPNLDYQVESTLLREIDVDVASLPPRISFEYVYKGIPMVSVYEFAAVSCEPDSPTDPPVPVLVPIVVVLLATASSVSCEVGIQYLSSWYSDPPSHKTETAQGLVQGFVAAGRPLFTGGDLALGITAVFGALAVREMAALLRDCGCPDTATPSGRASALRQASYAAQDAYDGLVATGVSPALASETIPEVYGFEPFSVVTVTNATIAPSDRSCDLPAPSFVVHQEGDATAQFEGPWLAIAGAMRANGQVHFMVRVPAEIADQPVRLWVDWQTDGVLVGSPPQPALLQLTNAGYQEARCASVRFFVPAGDFKLSVRVACFASDAPVKLPWPAGADTFYVRHPVAAVTFQPPPGT